MTTEAGIQPPCSELCEVLAGRVVENSRAGRWSAGGADRGAEGDELAVALAEVGLLEPHADDAVAAERLALEQHAVQAPCRTRGTGRRHRGRSPPILPPPPLVTVVLAPP